MEVNTLAYKSTELITGVKSFNSEPLDSGKVDEHAMDSAFASVSDHFVHLTFDKIDTLSICSFLDLQFYQLAVMLHSVTWKCVILSTCSYMFLPFSQLDVSLTQYFIN